MFAPSWAIRGVRSQVEMTRKCYGYKGLKLYWRVFSSFVRVADSVRATVLFRFWPGGLTSSEMVSASGLARVFGCSVVEPKESYKPNIYNALQVFCSGDHLHLISPGDAVFDLD